MIRQSEAIVSPLPKNLQSLIQSAKEISGVLLLVTILAAVTGFVYFLRFQDFYTPDSPSYVVSAANLNSGHGFQDAEGYPETFRTPGYPLLILPFLRFGIDLKYLIILQHLFRLALVLFTTLLAYRLSNSRRLALIAGILLCLDLPTLKAANTLMSEAIFTLVVSIVFWLLWRIAEDEQRGWKSSALAGFLMGAGVLVRPIGMFFFAPGAFYFFLVKRKLRSAILWSFVAGFSLLPLLWAARNYRETKRFTVSTVSGVDILYWRAAWVLAAHDPGDFNSNLPRRQVQLADEVCNEFKRGPKDDCNRWSPTQKSDYYLRVGTRVLLQHKSSYVLLSLEGAGRTLLGGDADRLAQILHVSYRPAAGILLCYTIPCLCFCLIGLFQAWRHNRFFFYLAFLFLLYFLGLTAGPEGYSRYRVPIMPVYAILAASGLDSILRRFHPREISSRVTA